MRTVHLVSANDRGERIIIEDVLIDPAFESHVPSPHPQVSGCAIHALLQPHGEPLGMISTHFRLPHRPRERELQLTDSTPGTRLN